MRGGSMTGTASSHLKTMREAAEVRGVLISDKFHNGTSLESSPYSPVIQLQPLALPALAAAQFLSISKRSLSRLIAAGKIVARKEGSRTLVDVESLKPITDACH
jgi:hypothetical protein